MWGPYEYLRARLNRVVDQEQEARFREQHKELIRETAVGARWRRRADGSWERWSHLGNEWELATPPDALVEMASNAPSTAEWTRTPYSGWFRIDAEAPPPPDDVIATAMNDLGMSAPPADAPAPPSPAAANPAPPSSPAEQSDPRRDTPSPAGDPWRDLPPARQKWDLEFKREEAFGWVEGAPTHSPPVRPTPPVKATPPKPAATPHGKEKRGLRRKKND